MHSQNCLSLWELQVIRDLFCVRNIAEKSLNRFLLLLILKSSKFHRKTPVFESLFSKVPVPRQGLTFLKRDSNKGIFPVKFAKILRTPILKNIYKPLLLYLQVISITIHEKYTANEVQLKLSETYLMGLFCENS